VKSGTEFLAYVAGMPSAPDDDGLLEGVLREAAIVGEPRGAVTSAYPTLDALLSATLDEIAEVGGPDEATRLWNVLERRWRFDSARADAVPGPPPSTFGQLIEVASTDERPSSLRVQLRVQALLDVTMRAAGFDPDLQPADVSDPAGEP
jgi:hypothetical protein